MLEMHRSWVHQEAILEELVLAEVYSVSTGGNSGSTVVLGSIQAVPVGSSMFGIGNVNQIKQSA